MRTIEINLYKFDELPEEIKTKAIEKLWDINVDHSWWDITYDDAEQIGIKITGFDIDRGNNCTGEFNLSAAEVAQNILNNHGEKCNTYNTASNFLEEFNPVFAEYMDESSEKFEGAEAEEDLLYLESEFLKSLLEDYLTLLRNEYEYLTSEKAIIETIEANEYEFLSDGSLS